MQPSFHLSIGVRSLDQSVDLLVRRSCIDDATGYVNLDFFGSQITLKQSEEELPTSSVFHFGINLAWDVHDDLVENIRRSMPETVRQSPVGSSGSWLPGPSCLKPPVDGWARNPFVFRLTMALVVR